VRALSTPRLLALAWLALVACQSAPTAPPPQQAAQPAPPPPAAIRDLEPAPLANRDLHGPPDVEGYIARLESPERLRDLDPELVIEKLALAPDAVIADLGCGPGIFSLRFARAAPRGVVYAIDVEPAQLDRLREQLLELAVENVVPVLASYSTPHLPPGSCDVIFIGDTYHHIDDRLEYMRRLRRALKPGGELVLFEYKPGTLPVGPPADHKLKAGELHAELERAGYELVRSFDTHPYHDFEIWRARPGADGGPGGR
jgi:SAM-dependent methyltransferase